jgi:hypothetical protein
MPEGSATMHGKTTVLPGGQLLSPVNLIQVK